MGSVRVSTDGAGNKGSTDLNYHSQDDKEVRNSVVGEGHGLSEEDELRINEVADDLNDGREVVVWAQAGLQKQQLPPLPPPPPPLPPPQQQNSLGPVVRWERFLPLRSLKVLLVENDDSTRHVVSALLRNCSYEVTTASNGLEAWKILKDLENHIDLVLTEVVMPCLSGIGLLCKIMNHKTCKNIPVIMMSCHDSMGVVFNCLSKGAVDFLVKPIRKNELKNLWQHVWRRCHSSSGSGSESGIQTQKSAKLKSGDESDNNSGSNDEDGNASIGLNARDGSDNGSGTQSSWTKRAVEVDSPQPMLPWDQVADPHDSTCAQVIHPKHETFSNDWVPITAIRECQEQKEQFLDTVEMGKDLEIGVPRNQDSQLESFPKEVVSSNITGTKQDKLLQQDNKKNKQPNEGLLKLDGKHPFKKLRVQAADLIGAIANSNTDSWMENRLTEAPNSTSKISETKDKATPDAKELPSLELSLKRLRTAGDVGTTHDDRNVLRHSDMSAFSRYNTAAAATQSPTGLGGSNSLPLENSSEAVKMEPTHNLASSSNATPLNQRSNGSSNNNDMGSTTNNAFTKPAALKDRSASTSAAKCAHPTSAFQPLQLSRAGLSQQIIPEKVVDVSVTAVGKPRGAHLQVQVQNHHHHYHHHHHRIHSMQQQQQPPDHDDLSLKNMAAAAPQCGSSNDFGGHVEGNGGNYSVNGSVSGSNHGSNGQNGSSTAVNTRGMNMESDNGIAGKSGHAGGSVSGSVSGSGMDQNRFAQRVATLTKFRQKRKERCFEKKVRYQSRKRLAEQRPRVRGQFVRQNVYENANRDTDC